VHGNDVTTLVLFESDDKEEIKMQGIYYSNKWGVTASPEFANLIPETGSGSQTAKGRIYTKEMRDNQRVKIKKTVDDKVACGNHNFVINNPVTKDKNHIKGNVTVFNNDGICMHIPKEQYHAQSGPKNEWEYVHNTSTEGKRRKLIMLSKKGLL
jgi:hypothetical protein